LADVSRALLIGNVSGGDGYSNDLESGLLSSTIQIDAVITNQTVTMEEILRADVNADNIVNLSDISLLQQNISLGTAFPAGASFTRAVLTVESLTDPLSTTPDIYLDLILPLILFHLLMLCLRLNLFHCGLKII